MRFRLVIPTVAVLALCAVAPASAAACARASALPSAGTARTSARAVLCLVNMERARAGLPAVRANRRLARAARRHSRDMVRRNFFDHTAPDGAGPMGRVERAGYHRGASWWVIGETIAWGQGGLGSPASIVQSWMESPGHRGVLLERGYRDVGIGLAMGVPGGGPGVTVTADFGARGG